MECENGERCLASICDTFSAEGTCFWDKLSYLLLLRAYQTCTKAMAFLIYLSVQHWNIGVVVARKMLVVDIPRFGHFSVAVAYFLDVDIRAV